MSPLIFRKEVLLYGIAGACLGFATISIAQSQPASSRTEPRGPVNAPPVASMIAATGILEPSSETILIVPEIEGRVSSVLVKAGDFVRKGQILYTLDDNVLMAAVDEARARVELARSEVALHRANIQSVKTTTDGLRFKFNQLSNRVERYRPLQPDAISPDEFEKLVTEANDAFYNMRNAENQLEASRHILNVAEKELALATKKLSVAGAQHERTKLRASIDGQVLSVNLREGDVFTAPRDPDLYVNIGNIQQLHVRAEINDTEVSRFYPGNAATAYLRDVQSSTIALRFLTSDQILTTKSQVNNQAAELTDMRILNVVYRVEGTTVPLYAGQLVDVYIETGSSDAFADVKPVASIQPPTTTNLPTTLENTAYWETRSGDQKLRF